MNSQYNLNDNVEEHFEFVLDNKKYRMKYPITEEIDEIQDISFAIQRASKADDVDTAEALGEKLSEKFYSFIEPVEHDVAVKDVLQKQNVRVMRNFNRMIKTELAIQ